MDKMDGDVGSSDALGKVYEEQWFQQQLWSLPAE